MFRRTPSSTLTDPLFPYTTRFRSEAPSMAMTRNATTHWEVSLMEGAGRVTLESSGLGTYDVTWASRANDPEGRTSPEELIAAAHSSCFSMAQIGRAQV